MTPITINIPHKLGKAEARTRLQSGFVKLKDQFGGGMMKFEERWEGDKLHFSARGLGQQIRGRMDVEDACVKIEVDLPDFLANMAEAIKGRVQKQGQILLEDKRK